MAAHELFTQPWRARCQCRPQSPQQQLPPHNGPARGQKTQANNNLAGATWEQSISAEMQAHATMCDMRSRELIAHRDRLEQELRQLQTENP